MSKFLDKAIKEMRSYGEMGLPDGETAGGMGDTSKNPVVNAYRMNNILRRRQKAEEEEMSIDGGMRDADMPDDEEQMDDKDYSMDMPGDEDAMGMEMDVDVDAMDDGAVDTEEMKSFFQENPTPSDEEVMQFASERGIDMEQMRQEVYALIQELLGSQDPVGDGEADAEFAAGDDDEIEFSAPIDKEEDLSQGM
jgi:hypothetical protein